MTRLGDLFLARGLCSADQIEEAVRQQVLYGGRLGTNLVELNYVSIAELAQALTELHKTPLPEYTWLQNPERQAVRRVSRPLVEKYRFIPMKLEDRLLHVALLDPHDPPTLDELRFATGCRIKGYVLPQLLMEDWLQWLFQVPRSLRHVDTSRVPERLQTQKRASHPETSQHLVADQAQGSPGVELRAAAEQLLGARARQQAPAAAGGPAATQPVEQRMAQIDLGQWQHGATGVSAPPRPQGEGHADHARALRTRASEAPAPRPASGERRSVSVSEPAAPVAVPQGSVGARAEDALTPQRPGPGQIAEHERAIQTAEDRDSLIEHALMAATGFADFAALLLVNQGMVEGMKGCDAGQTPRDVGGVLLPLASDSAFAQAAQGREGARHSFELPMDHRMLARFGRGTGGKAVMVPVLLRERVVNILYADNGQGDVAEASFAGLRSLAKTLSDAYARLILRRKGG
ncbi:MAG: hypothetical protein OXU20_13405 [Myxococcales bacterium]|nr:hypothetical protein [Myxococcales bacterium]